ncbi:hypothetical protein GHT06_013877 [Daphnia sinensis]|uniref:Uncharacterized protein n=1 Tax=Daphnia sinensis TaxID=1820382 RepID=A0AAD5LBX5_9CRUS|nr:hypothetical protein GHT06_013877 [Daphnia sinensis]
MELYIFFSQSPFDERFSKWRLMAIVFRHINLYTSRVFLDGACRRILIRIERQTEFRERRFFGRHAVTVSRVKDTLAGCASRHSQLVDYQTFNLKSFIFICISVNLCIHVASSTRSRRPFPAPKGYGPKA